MRIEGVTDVGVWHLSDMATGPDDVLLRELRFDTDLRELHRGADIHTPLLTCWSGTFTARA
jgi:hypothetical protein